MNILIALETALARVGWRKTAELKDLRKNIERHLLWEDPKKARELTDDEILTLMSETEPEFAVVNSLLIPFGMRFADAARVRICDVESVQGNVCTLRIRQAKNILKRAHQRWHSMVIPSQLLGHLKQRLRSGDPRCPLITVGYRQYQRYLKRTISRTVSTYSIRITALNRMAQRVATVEELQKVTLHRNADQLRRYLNRPLKDETDLQTRVTAWHMFV
eukprot:PhM_4_TR15644/c2_g1_i2/m.6800